MKKRTRNMIIIAIVILLIGYLIMQRSKLKKMTDPNNPDNWDGTPVQCCWCDGGSPICNQFNQPTCPNGKTPMKDYEALDCGHSGMAK